MSKGSLRLHRGIADDPLWDSLKACFAEVLETGDIGPERLDALRAAVVAVAWEALDEPGHVPAENGREA